ncbi:myeloid leukemia factor isoform X3 [Hyposmocoma kahamanoa]|uniref:myeloid leukemia factor isoform X3 n=1 Tax=Hyposmocoma kahamanoa TaxID=1477025 RepID=UPI000E6D982D|nr:myeloid leukemia factor isoform X3 [Hyposmocoma kahamanoa]XP_026318419.1 myeloid leukemia factor isoform X3 [Hyposmocoma kahamanoa]
MSLFGSLMADVEDDPFFGSHMRHMRQMNNMMNSLFSDPFGMLGEVPLAIGGPRHGSALMPFMPQMPSLNKLFSGDMFDGHMGAGSSFSSSTVVMSSGPNFKPQVYSSTSSTKIGPNGVKETRKTLQDSRTGTKKMSIGHHIGERAHLIEREQNYYSGDAEEHQEFINIDEDDAEEFDREFQMKAGAASAPRYRSVQAGRAPPPAAPQRLALPPAPSTQTSNSEDTRRHSHSASSLSHSGHRHSGHGHGGHSLIAHSASGHTASTHSHSGHNTGGHSPSGHYRPSVRRPLRPTASPLTTRYWRRRYYY